MATKAAFCHFIRSFSNPPCDTITALKQPQNPAWTERGSVPGQRGRVDAPATRRSRAVCRGRRRPAGRSGRGLLERWRGKYHVAQTQPCSKRTVSWLAAGFQEGTVNDLFAARGCCEELLEKPPHPDSWRGRQPFAGLCPAPKARLLGTRSPREGSAQIKALTGRAVHPVRSGKVGLFPSRLQEGRRLKCHAGDPFAPAAPLPSHLASLLSVAPLHFSSPFPANHRPFGGVHERCHSWSQPNACTTPSPWVFSPPAPILAASQRAQASEQGSRLTHPASPRWLQGWDGVGMPLVTLPAPGCIRDASGTGRREGRAW